MWKIELKMWKQNFTFVFIPFIQTLWQFKFSSGVHHLWDVSTLWLRSICGKVDWLDRKTHLSWLMETRRLKKSARLSSILDDAWNDQDFSQSELSILKKKGLGLLWVIQRSCKLMGGSPRRPSLQRGQTEDSSVKDPWKPYGDCRHAPKEFQTVRKKIL